jgi:hypothetical protein
MRYLFFWHIAHQLTIGDQCSRQHGGLKKSGTNHTATWHPIPDEQRPQLHNCESLQTPTKSGILLPNQTVQYIKSYPTVQSYRTCTFTGHNQQQRTASCLSCDLVDSPDMRVRCAGGFQPNVWPAGVDKAGTKHSHPTSQYVQLCRHPHG